jgi:hypothetical protein
VREKLLIHAAIVVLEVWIVVWLLAWARRSFFDTSFSPKFWVPYARIMLASILALMLFGGHAFVAWRQSQR